MSTPYNSGNFDQGNQPQNDFSQDNSPQNNVPPANWPQYPPAQGAGYYNPSGGYTQPTNPPKSKLIALLLAFFLGSLGIHNFYGGNKQQAIIQLVLTLVGWLTAVILIGFVLVFAVWIWVIVDLILIATGSGYWAVDEYGRQYTW